MRDQLTVRPRRDGSDRDLVAAQVLARVVEQRAREEQVLIYPVPHAVGSGHRAPDARHLEYRSIRRVNGRASISGFLHEVTDVETVDDEVRRERCEIALQLDVGENGGITVDSAVQHFERRPFARTTGRLVEQGLEE